MQVTGAHLINETAPGGIVSFEFAGSLDRSAEIMESWQGDAMGWAKINMGIDFIFLSCYALAIALACLLVSSRVRNLYPLFASWGRWFALVILVAAGLDVIENLALIALLSGWQHTLLPILAKVAAIPKFIMVALSLLYALVGFGLTGLIRLKHPATVS